MPGLNGVELQEALRSQGYHTPVIVITAFPNEKLRARALDAEAIGFLSKPFDEGSLIKSLTDAIKGEINLTKINGALTGQEDNSRTQSPGSSEQSGLQSSERRGRLPFFPLRPFAALDDDRRSSARALPHLRCPLSPGSMLGTAR